MLWMHELEKRQNHRDSEKCGLPCKPRFHLDCIDQWLQGEAERGACHVWGESEKGECAGRERSCECSPASTVST